MDYWNSTKKLMITILVLWGFFSFVVHGFVDRLNEIVILGFPMGYYMASQGSLIAFVVMIFYFASKQDKIDHKYDVAEKD